MPFPIAMVTGTTATGDKTIGPGCLKFLVNGKPAATIVSAVTGTVCTGVITSTMHPTMILGGLPVASLACVVTGVNPITGVPVSTAEAISPALTFIV